MRWHFPRRNVVDSRYPAHPTPPAPPPTPAAAGHVSLSFLLRFPLASHHASPAAVWHVRGTRFPLHCSGSRMLKLLRFFLSTQPAHTHTRTAHTHTHPAVSCLAAAAIKDDTSKTQRSAAWHQATLAQGNCHGYSARTRRTHRMAATLRQRPLNAPNHNLTGAAMTQFTHSPTCNLQLRLKCVCGNLQRGKGVEEMPAKIIAVP